MFQNLYKNTFSYRTPPVAASLAYFLQLFPLLRFLHLLFTHTHTHTHTHNTSHHIKQINDYMKTHKHENIRIFEKQAPGVLLLGL